MRFLLATLFVAGLCGKAVADPAWPELKEAAAAARMGDRQKALTFLAAARRQTLNAGRREQVALLYADLKEYGIAQALINDLIEQSPQDATLRLYLATIVARAGDRAATLKALAEASERLPSALDRQRMAFLYLDFKDYAPAQDLLDGLIAESPGNLSVRLDRASLAAQTGDIAGGNKHLSAARALKPGPSDLRRMARLYQELHNYNQANILLDTLIEQSPWDVGLRYQRAVLVMKLGDHTQALEALSQAHLYAKDFDDRRHIAALYQELQEFREARSILQGIVRDAPRSPRAHLELARLDAHHGERATALKSLKAATRLEPDLQERQAIALIYEDLKEYQTARRMIDALIAEQPQDPQLHLDLAYFAADIGNKTGALSHLSQTLKRNPDPDDRRRIALLYERLGAHTEARDILDTINKKRR